MNSKKHKLPRRILAMLLAICMFVTMFPSAMFAVEGGTSRTAGTIDGTEESPKTVSSEDGITINKYVSAGTQEGQYDLTLEAYASDQLTTTSTSKPLDIVLVLDVSGSMEDPFIDSGFQVTEVYQFDESKTYYIEDTSSYFGHRSVKYDLDKQSWGYWTGWKFHPVTPKISADDNTAGHTQFYDWVYVEGQSKMDALKSAVNGFISSVAEKNQDITEEDNKHRISIVKFADDSYGKGIGNDRFDAGHDRYYNFTQQVIEFSSDVSALTNAVNDIKPGGATAADYGLGLANTVMDQARDTSEKVVVFFTDGSPNHGNGFDNAVANDAIEEAKKLKDENVKIYSVGVFEDEDDEDINDYMNGVSSNYPNATSLYNLGKQQSAEYYFTASSSADLNNIFEGIADSVTEGQLTINPDADAVLSDTLSQYFNFPKDLTADSQKIQVQYARATGYNPDTKIFTFGEPGDLPSDAGKPIVTITTDGTITVTGFDYKTYAASYNKTTEAVTGGKLVVTFPIEVDENAVLDNPVEGNMYPTNVTTYDPEKDEKDNRAKLSYKSDEQVGTNDDSTVLTESPAVFVNRETFAGNGTDVTVQVYVDGTPVTNPLNYVTLSRDTDDTSYRYYKVSDSNNDGILDFDFNYYTGDNGSDCVDIEVELTEFASEYVLQGVTSYQSYGKSGTSNVKDNSEVGDPKRDTYTVDNVTASDDDNDIDCKIYLRSKYSVQYTQNGESIDGYTDNAVYISQEDVGKTTSPGQYPTNDTPTQMTWKNNNYETFIDLRELPNAEAGFTVDGWFVGENEYDPENYDADNKLSVATALNGVTGKTIIFNATTTENAPEKPDEEKLIADLDSIVKVDCVNTNYNDGNGHAVGGPYALLVESISEISDVTLDNDAYTVTFKVSPVDGYADAYNSDSVSGGKNHTMQSKEAVDVTATYDKDQNKWTTSTEVIFDVKCDDPLGVSSIAKNVVTADQKDSLPDEVNTALDGKTIQYPQTADGAGNPELTVEEGTDVTLLYVITVAGDSGAGFSVSESNENAELVKVVGAKEADESVEGALFTGTLERETATLYVSVDYGAQNMVGSKELKNIATVTNTDPDAEEPEKDKDTETVDEKVTPVYDITSIEKTYIAGENKISEETATDIDFSKYAVPDKESNNVIVPNDGTNVTLLYSIKVTGTEGATFTVKDEGATFVTYESDETIDGKAAVSGAQNTFTGTIPKDGEVTFYVEKSFNKDNIVNGELSNTVTIEGDVDPDQDEATENVPAEVEKAKLDSIDKVYIADSDNVGKTEPEISFDAYTYQDSEIGKVVVPENGEVTLLYGITVKGTAGAQFVVMDDSANFVACASSDKLDDGKAAVSGSKDLFEGTLPADGEVTFYVSKTFTADDIRDGKLTNTAEAKLLGEKDTINDTEETGAVKEDKPNIPTGDDLIALIGDKVTVDCINGMVNHDDKTYGLLKDGYNVDETLSKNDQGQYTFNVKINPDVYVDQYSSDMKKEHTLQNAGSSFTITLTWDGIKWIVPTDNVVLKVECQYAITAFDKFLVDTDDEKTATGLAADELARYTFPDANGTVNVPKNGKVTLLYGITVTGTAGESFTVKDTGAVPAPNVGDVIKLDKDGNFTGTIPESGSITFYVERVFTADDIEVVDGKDSLINKATIVGDVTPGEEDDDEIVPAATGYSLTYEANGGYFANDTTVTTATVNELEPDTYDLWSEEDSTIPVGADGNALAEPSHAQAAPPENSVITDADLVDVVLIGWTKEVPESVGKIYAAGEAYPALTTDATITEDDVIVYAVWGYDENADGIADAEQVIVTPADIRIYTGGNGYSDVVDDADQEVVDSKTSDGLPTPGYYIILPFDVNEKVLAQAESDGETETNKAGQEIADLSKYLSFDYKNGEVTRHWEIERYDKAANDNNSMAYNKFIYRINPATTNVEGESVPIRLLFTDADGEEQTSDDFTVSTDTLYQTFDMTIYAGDLERGLIKVTFDQSTDVSKQDIGVGSGTLTVRGVVTDEDTVVNTTDILEPNADVDSATNVSVQKDTDTKFYINDSDLEVADENQVKLLVDSTVSDESDATMRDMAESQFSDTITEEHSVDMKYLDLVDTSNGNAWVTTGGDEVTVFWPYPADADPNGEFYVVHYEGLDRDAGGSLDEYNAEQMTLYSTEETAAAGTKIEKTDNGITFTVDSFSPFAVYYTAKADTPDTPDNPGWTPDGGDDGPDGLNTEDHFSYIVGYAEDYRTGEPTDNEDLWPVKPNNQITRAEVATIFYRLLEDEVRDEYDTTVNDFSDVSADSWYNQTVSTLASMEIVKGYEDGTFRPNAPITRAEFGAIATRFFAETGATYVPGTFTDVTGDEWYANAIQDAVNLGLIGGYPDGTVRPNNNITRAEACAIVNRTLGRVPDADHLLPEDVMKVWPDNNPTDWFYADMQEATNGHEYAWIEEDGHEIEEWTNLLDKDWTDR